MVLVVELLVLMYMISGCFEVLLDNERVRPLMGSMLQQLSYYAILVNLFLFFSRIFTMISLVYTRL